MKSSVLISVYKNDSPAYLKLALESIYQKQSMKPDEIVIVEDGPITNLLEDVISNFVAAAGCSIKLVKLKQNRGLGHALRIGAKVCTGDIIFRMDSDDVSDSERFEKQYDFLEKHQDIDVVGSDIGEFESDFNDIIQTRICPAKHEKIVEMGKIRNPMNHVTTAIRRKALEQVGGYKTLMLIEDYYLWIRMIANGCRLANINENLVYVRIGNGFGSRRGSKERIKSWKVLQRYMLKHNMITKFTAFKNMCYIKAFVYAPAGLRDLLYKKVLRKKTS